MLHDEEDGDDGDGDGLRHFSTTTMRTFSNRDYTVGWVCALPLEMAAAKAMLDEIYTSLKKQPNDHNTYRFGWIGEHTVVVACLPLGVYGTTSAATVVSQMLSSFSLLQFWFMVCSGGGVPGEKADI